MLAGLSTGFLFKKPTCIYLDAENLDCYSCTNIRNVSDCHQLSVCAADEVGRVSITFEVLSINKSQSNLLDLAHSVHCINCHFC